MYRQSIAIPLVALVSIVATTPVAAQTVPNTDELIEDILAFGSGPAALAVSLSNLEALHREQEMGRESLTLAPRTASSLYTVPVSYDPQDDYEPSVLSMDAAGRTNTSVVYIKRTSTDPLILRNFSGWSDQYNGFPGNRKRLPMPSNGDYEWSADPLQHANTFSNGIAPERLYATGLLLNSGAQSEPPNAIAVWHSDDGGEHWSQPVIVERNDSTSLFVDKPDVGVSWHSATRGYVYVAYARFSGFVGQDKILLARSTDGGQTFDGPFVVTAGDSMNGAQVLISPFGGRVYVIWTDFDEEVLRMAQSDDLGETWTAPETIVSVNVVDGGDRLDGDIRALTLPMARYNSVHNSIGVVWHEFEFAGSSETDVYFAAKTTSGWTNKQVIEGFTVNDQFHAALDFDPDGNYMIVHYDRSQDVNNVLYKEAWVQTDPFGNVLDSGYASPLSVDPFEFRLVNVNFVGDYQDVWWWSFSDQFGDRFTSVWQGADYDSNQYDDILISGID